MTSTPAKKFRIPIITRWSNGLTLLYLHTENDPTSAAHFFLPGGVSDEGPKPRGATALLWSLLLQGTQSKSARSLAESIESLGASIGGSGTHDQSEVSCHAISENFLEALKIFQDVLFNPSYKDKEVEKEKAALVASIRAKKESIFTETYESTNAKLYGPHPYGAPSSGTESTVGSLRSRDLNNLHKKLMTPTRAIISVATSLPYNLIENTIQSLFGPKVWDINSNHSWRPLKKTPLLKKNLTTQNQTKFEQAFLMMAYPALDVTSPDFVPTKVLNGLLGGGMSARLFQALREKEGLAYDVGSFFPSKKYGSSFYLYMGLQMARMEEAKERMKKEIEKIKQEKISPEELEMTKNYMKGTYILDHQTNSQRAHYAGWWKSLGLDLTFENDYIEQIEQVTPEKIQDIAQKIFSRPFVLSETHPKSAKKSNA